MEKDEMEEPRGPQAAIALGKHLAIYRKQFLRGHLGIVLRYEEDFSLRQTVPSCGICAKVFFNLYGL